MKKSKLPSWDEILSLLSKKIRQDDGEPSLRRLEAFLEEQRSTYTSQDFGLSKFLANASKVSPGKGRPRRTTQEMTRRIERDFLSVDTQCTEVFRQEASQVRREALIRKFFPDVATKILDDYSVTTSPQCLRNAVLAERHTGKRPTPEAKLRVIEDFIRVHGRAMQAIKQFVNDPSRKAMKITGHGRGTNIQ